MECGRGLEVVINLSKNDGLYLRSLILQLLQSLETFHQFQNCLKIVVSGLTRFYFIYAHDKRRYTQIVADRIPPMGGSVVRASSVHLRVSSYSGEIRWVYRPVLQRHRCVSSIVIRFVAAAR